MPCSLPSPSPAPLPVHSQGRPGHRRSYSNERGPGAFAPLRQVPRRSSGPVFHFRNDEPDHDDDESSSSHDDQDDHSPPALKLRSGNSFHLTLDTSSLPSPKPKVSHQSVPFPRSSPTQVASPVLLSPTAVRPPVARTASTPILLANGKPLKSSLKSSSSSPHIPSHLRARSAPSTPHPDRSPSPDELMVPPPTPKNVHFPPKETGALETIRIFNKSARPASLSRPTGEDTETETEGEAHSYSIGRTSFPFPRFPGSSPIQESPSPPPRKSQDMTFEVDLDASSTVPSRAPPSHANVLLESITLASTPIPTITGHLLVRNLAYEKQVAIRFTLDDWVTTSEVIAQHVISLPGLPPSFASLSDVTNQSDKVEWDRFAFTIRLGGYALKLDSCVLWLVARYTTPGVVTMDKGNGAWASEWWDNNGGSNYKVAFRRQEAEAPKHERAVSAPAIFSASFAPAPSIPKAAVSPSQAIQLPSHQAMSQTTISHLRRLSLKNYSAPSAHAAVPVTPPTTVSFNPPASSPVTVPSPKPRSSPSEFGIGASPSMASSPPFSSMSAALRQSSNSWIWDSVAKPPRHEDDDDDDSASSSSSSSGLRTPPALNSPPDSPSVMIELEKRHGSSPRHSPPPQIASKSPSPVTDSQDVNSPLNAGEENSSDSGTDSEPIVHDHISSPSPMLPNDASESLYQAFVRKWCFAQGPGPSGRIVTI